MTSNPTDSSGRPHLFPICRKALQGSGHKRHQVFGGDITEVLQVHPSLAFLPFPGRRAESVGQTLGNSLGAAVRFHSSGLRLWPFCLLESLLVVATAFDTIPL